MEEELNDLHHLSSVVFTNIGGITPSIKNLIAHGKAFHKSYQSTIALGTQFIQSLGVFAQSALEAKGATHSVGETLSDIINIFCEIESMKGDLMNVFLNEVIVPLDNRAEQEVNMSKLAYKQYLQDNKVQTEVVAKLAQDIVKLRKKSQKKKGKSGKYEKKEEELLEEFENEEKQLRNVREQGLRRALIGERRIYCFVADRLSSFGRGLAAHSNRISSMLNEKLDVWNTVVSNPSELPAESENVVQNPSVHYTATIRRKKQNITSPVKSNSSENSSRPSAMGKEIFDTIHENETADDIEAQRKTSVDGVGENLMDSNGVDINHEVGRGDAMLTNGENDIRRSFTLSHRDLAPSTDNTALLRAIYSHTGKDSSQLSFSKGDLIFKLSQPNGGWQYGKHKITEKAGWFPAAYVERIEPVSVSNPILSALQEVGRSISQLHENGPTRRYSTPATTTLPYIPAPDYEDASGSIPIGNGNARKVSLEELHISASAPGLTSSSYQNHTRAAPEIIAPPPFASVGTVSAPGNIQNKDQEVDVVAMPFPPPPPTLGVDEQAEEPSNPFADIKLKKAVTNDRSMPKIS